MAAVVNRISDIRPLPESPHTKMATLVIANRREIAGAGIEALLQAGGYGVVARCLYAHDLLHSVEALRPDIIFLAENIVCHEAAKTVSRLRTENSSVSIIFLLDERDTIEAADLVSLDVDGILLSAASARSVIDCVESVYRGRKWVDPDLLRHLAMAERPSQNGNCLTSREAEIAQLVSRGLRNKEIARELRLCEGTVKMHLHHIYEKLRLGGRTQLALSMAGVTAQMPICSDAARPVGEPIVQDPEPASRFRFRSA